MADQRKGKRYAHYDPAYEAYIRRLLERQQGVSAPEGSEADYYAPPLTKYVDPRDKYAGSPIASGIANVLGGILQPGRASNIEEMNRQHFESLPQQQAQQSSLLTDSQLEALKQKALGGDENAQQLLATYVRTLNPPRTSTGGMDASFWRSQAGDGVAGRDPAGSARLSGGAPVTTSPTGEPTAETTAEPIEESTEPSDIARRILRDDFRHGATLALYPEEAIQQATSKLKARKIKEQQTLALAKGDLAQHPDHPQTTLYIQKAEARIEDIDSKLSAISGRPAAGGGGPTEAPNQ